ncbi:MAG: hypothetical protein QM756_28015 [Polyangiaceae bacterium]
MTATKKAKKSAAQKRERKERRFTPEATYASRITTYVGMAGALALGAGVYAQWLTEDPKNFAPYLLALGSAGFLGSLWKGSNEVGPLRVGDAGIAVENSDELTRILWCDIERVSLSGGVVQVKGKQQSISFPADAHPKALAWLLSEGGRRVPDVLALKRTEIEALPEPKEHDGELVNIDELQVAGRHCRASDKPIAFERDARLCPNCGESYLKDHVPKKCLTCQAELGSRAREV